MTQVGFPQGASAPATVCVLDTHVVLEAFWFGDARVEVLFEGLRAGQLTWIASPAMRAELESVLPRINHEKYGSRGEHVLTSFDRLTSLTRVEPPAAALRCDDPGDQMFVDLAFACEARWLFTRDKALRRLASRMAAARCCVAPPERYPRLKAGSAPGT